MHNWTIAAVAAVRFVWAVFSAERVLVNSSKGGCSLPSSAPEEVCENNGARWTVTGFGWVDLGVLGVPEAVTVSPQVPITAIGVVGLA
jgi:hypothetical protein